MKDEGLRIKNVYIILHNIRSVFNVGSIFRTADAAGVKKIYLTGYTPAPTDRFGRTRKDLVKASLGAEQTVPWEHSKKIQPLLRKLKAEGVAIIALEQSPHSVDYQTVRIHKPTAIILGNEVGGIPRNILTLCHTVAEIPMRGTKESLNVSVAAGIFLFRILD